MRSTRIALARDVQTRLNEAERQHDLSMISTAKLATALLEGSVTLGAAACVGQQAVEKIVGYLMQQTDSRRTLVEAHASLAEVRSRVGLNATATGGSAPKNPDEFFEPTGVAAGGQLTLVRDEAA